MGCSAKEEDPFRATGGWAFVLCGFKNSKKMQFFSNRFSGSLSQEKRNLVKKKHPKQIYMGLFEVASIFALVNPQFGNCLVTSFR